MPTAYIMIGVPGSGKSTWIKNQTWATNCVNVNTDDYVEKFARRLHSTYSECFDLVMPRAVKLMIRKLINARNNKKDIIWDQTSTTISSRRKKINMLRGYKLVGVVMPILTRTELKSRIDSRIEKNIPDHVLNNMLDFYESPSIAEGFHEIWNAN